MRGTATVTRAPWRPEIIVAIERAEEGLTAGLALALAVSEIVQKDAQSAQSRWHNNPPEPVDVEAIEAGLIALRNLREIAARGDPPRAARLQLIVYALRAAARTVGKLLSWLGEQPAIRRMVEAFFEKGAEAFGGILGKAVGTLVALGLLAGIAGAAGDWGATIIHAAADESGITQVIEAVERVKDGVGGFELF